MSIPRLSISVAVSLAVVLVPFMIFNAAPSYGTMALVCIAWFPGIAAARLFLPAAPPSISGIDFILGAISCGLYVWLLYSILRFFGANRRE